MTSTESLWQTLVARALIGTERQTTEPLQNSGALGTFLAALDPADAEGTLLGTAAAVALQRRAGYIAAPDTARILAPSPPDSIPICSTQAAKHLGIMLSGDYRDLLPEWLGALAATGRVVPPEHLAALLDVGRDNRSLRPLIVPVLGARGRWLASLNEEWDYAALSAASSAESFGEASDLAAQWETGSRQLRLSLLQQLRQTDPATARTYVATSWATERADERAAFLEAFGVGLSLDDEPFLEAALDDRSAAVRTRAADLLAQLPGSRLAQRMISRALSLLRWLPGESARMFGLLPGNPPQIEVTLPASPDKAAQRDGIEQKRRHTKLGEGAWWLQQIIARTPPSVWITHFGASAAAIMDAMIDPAWRTIILMAWAEAAQRYRDVPWAEALLDFAAREPALGLDNVSLLALLPTLRREQFLLALLRNTTQPLSGDHPALAPLRAYRTPWSSELGTAVLASLRRRITTLPPGRSFTDWHLRAAMEEFALQLPPQLAPAAATLWDGKRDALDYWDDAIARFEGIVAFRAAMHSALNQY